VLRYAHGGCAHALAPTKVHLLCPKKNHTLRATRRVAATCAAPQYLRLATYRCVAGAHSGRAANSLMTSRSAGHEMGERKKTTAPR